MRQLFLILSLILLLVSSQAHAQTNHTPIIALNEGAIYAVNPLDGSAEILVPAPNAYAESREFSHDPVTVFSAEWLSPDGQYLAYRMLYPLNPAEPIDENTSFTQRLFILDLAKRTFPASLNLGINAPYIIESLTWSLDGNLLYVLVQADNQWFLAIIERETWELQSTVNLASLDRVKSRRIYATENGLIMLDRGIQSLIYQFTRLDSAGLELNSFEIDWTISDAVNLYVNTPFTPLLVDGVMTYAFVDMRSGELLYTVDFATGEVSEFESGYFTGMISPWNPSNSLRISAGTFSGDGLELYIRDAESHYLGGSSYINAYAFGILGDSIGSTFAISPDGQSVVYLEDDVVMTLWENGESRILDFEARVVVWAAPSYVPVYDPAYLRG